MPASRSPCAPGRATRPRRPPGLAHLLEHLFFTGTERRPSALAISREIDLLGARTNAYTDTEDVLYFAGGPASTLPALVDILADMLCHPRLDAEELERERTVVLQELAGRRSKPSGWITDNLRGVAFGGDQPMARAAAGDREVIARAGRDALLAYRRTFYAPQSMALVVSGGARLAAGAAAELLADLPPATPRPRRPAVWGQGERYVADIRTPSRGRDAQVDLALALPGLPAGDGHRTALSLMLQILGGGPSSRLFQTVRSEHGLCYRISAAHEHFEDAGLFAIATTTAPEDACRAVELSVAELTRMASEPVTDEELAGARASSIARVYRHTETAEGSAYWHATRWRAGRLQTPDERAAEIASVTAAEVLEVAGRIRAGLGDARLAFVGPADQGEELLSAAAA